MLHYFRTALAPPSKNNGTLCAATLFESEYIAVLRFVRHATALPAVVAPIC